MFITVTSSHVTPDELKIIQPFMDSFLPKLRKVPGVLAVYYSVRLDKGDETTFIVWENPDAIKTYREGPLLKEALDFEASHGLSSAREGYPIDFVA
jgi:quinol monooxygenase YgiN